MVKVDATTTKGPPGRRHRAAPKRGRALKAPVPRRPEKDPIERLGGLAVLLLIALSLGGHLGLFRAAVSFGMLNGPQQKPKPSKLEVAVVEKKVEPPKPPPPEPPKPKPPPPPKKIIKLDKPLPPPPKNAPPPPPDAPPPPPDVKPALPPPTTEAAKPTPNAVPLVGISLSSTSAAGSFAMNVGNTAMGQVARVAPKPQDVKPYKAERYVPVYQLPEAPVFLNNVSETEMEKFYPQNARRDEVEDTVEVKLVVDDDGTVAQVKVVSWIHKDYAFDEAAKKLAKLYRFKPAKLDGKAVATEITFTIRWELPY
jgi:protein TonB